MKNELEGLKEEHINISEDNELALSELELGKIVLTEGSVGYGVVVGLNPSPQPPVSVTTPLELTDTVPQNIRVANLYNIDSVVKALARKSWKKTFGWQTGKAGYLVRNGEVIPVAFGRKNEDLHVAIDIGESHNRVFELADLDLENMFDDREEAYINVKNVS